MRNFKKTVAGLFAGMALLAAAGPSIASADTGTVVGGRDRLGDLVIMDKLFKNDSILSGGNNIDLGDLFILDQAFNRSGNPISGQRLSDLFVLDRVFGNSNTSLLSRGDGTRLGDVFILDQLFR